MSGRYKKGLRPRAFSPVQGSRLFSVQGSTGPWAQGSEFKVQSQELTINKKNKKLNTHTLRFWEKHFKQIKPKLLSGNRRYYSDKDIKYIKLIYVLLKTKGFTINGAKKALNDPSIKLDDTLISSVNKENFKFSLKTKLVKIKRIINRIKKENNG